MNIRENNRQRAIQMVERSKRQGIKKKEWLYQAKRYRRWLYDYCRLNLPEAEFHQITSSQYYSHCCRTGYMNRIMPYLLWHGCDEDRIVEEFFGRKFPETKEWADYVIKDVEQWI